MHEGVVSAEEADGLIRAYRDALDKGRHVEHTVLSNYPRPQAGLDAVPGHPLGAPTDTTLPAKRHQKRLADKVASRCRKASRLHPTVDKGAGRPPPDGRWRTAGGLGHGGNPGLRLAGENGYGVRISGEDSAVAPSAIATPCCTIKTVSAGTGRYVPLRHLSENQAEFLVIDSILEEAVLAYEYGYACSAPDQLVIWEAQLATSPAARWRLTSSSSLAKPNGAVCAA